MLADLPLDERLSVLDVALFSSDAVGLQEKRVSVGEILLRGVGARKVGGDTQGLAPDPRVVSRRVQTLDWRGVEQ